MSSDAARAIEAILMVAQEPVDPHLLAQLLEVAPAVVEATCEELEAGYQAQDRGFALVKIAGGYRFQSRAELAAYVERFALEGQSARLSNAALETLAIVAYKQPLSRAQVAAIRGVNVDGVMRTLQQRGYIAEVGRDGGPGQATLFGTTSEFLERMGLDRIEDLPDIAALFPSAEVLEALEQTLRATAPEPPEGLAAVPPEGTAEPADGQPATPEEVRAIDEQPAPEPPAWALDLTTDPSEGPADDPTAVAADDAPVDLDGDGSADLDAEP